MGEGLNQEVLVHEFVFQSLFDKLELGDLRRCICHFLGQLECGVLEDSHGVQEELTLVEVVLDVVVDITQVIDSDECL